MSTRPKLLAPIVITPANDSFKFEQGGAQSVVITNGTYSSILEVLANLEAGLQAVSATFAVTVSSAGIVSIACNVDWDTAWGSTDDALEELLGFDTSEAVSAGSPYTLTATDRHLRGWYSPVGIRYPADRYRIDVREQETDAGGMTQLASSGEHRYRDLQFSLLSEPQMSIGGTDSDGAGGTVDWTNRTLLDFWRYTAARSFRLYEDPTLGTVAAPGTEGVDFVTCRRRAEEWRPDQIDPGSWAFFDVQIPVKVVGAL